jgi:hypothetical protein
LLPKHLETDGTPGKSLPKPAPQSSGKAAPPTEFDKDQPPPPMDNRR